MTAFIRKMRLAATWWVRDRFDRLVFSPPVERLLLRRRRRISDAGPEIRRLYVDMSVISQTDAGTGIQRVVRSVYARLSETCAQGIEILPVVMKSRKEGYRTIDGLPLQGGGDAVFLGLDFSADAVFRQRRALAGFKAAGGRLWFLLHDVLPLSHPHWFTCASGVKYRRWLRTCASLADGFLCVSPVVAEQLDDLLRVRYGLTQPPRISTISLGSTITPDDLHPDLAALPLISGLTRETFTRAALVVGTLEPRKGHDGLLDAFDLCWKKGEDIPLVLIGRPGWGTARLQRRLRRHPARGTLLFWLDGVEDAALLAAYDACRMVIVPSLAEGYGLPLDEALAMGAPVLARDIPVFRRHEDAALAYFPEHARAQELADTILRFRADVHRPETGRQLPDWSRTSRECLEAIGCAR